MNIKKEYLYLGIGFLTITMVGTAAVVLANRSKIDLGRFDSPDLPGSGKCMNKDFLKMLQKLQKKTGYPIFKWINSGARTAYWNAKVGGVSNSAHKVPTCRAADIGTPSTEIRDKLVAAAKEVGFKRIGIGSNFVHLDNDPDKPQYTAWGYPNNASAPYRVFG